MRIGVALKQDIQFQFRHGFYYAYLFVSLIYMGILRSLPLAAREWVTPLIIFTDPAVLGFFFIGGILLLERDQNILEHLFVTPLRVNEYFIAKVGSLTLLAVISSVMITMIGVGLEFQWQPLVIGVILSSCFFTIFGVILAVRAKSLNEYIIISPVSVVFCLPIFEYLHLWSAPIFRLTPGWAGLELLVGSVQGMSNVDMIWPVLNLLIWIILAYWVARREFEKYIILKIGGER